VDVALAPPETVKQSRVGSNTKGNRFDDYPT